MTLPPPWAWLVGYLAVLAVERVGELALSQRNVRRLLARGAREVGAGHFWMFVVLHGLYPVALVLEVAAGARPGPHWPVWLALWLLAQALRVAAVAALGERWSVRIVALPGASPIRRGIYRWLAHPNYLAVALEFLSAPRSRARCSTRARWPCASRPRSVRCARPPDRRAENRNPAPIGIGAGFDVENQNRND
jgi:methyltransferase